MAQSRFCRAATALPFGSRLSGIVIVLIVASNIRAGDDWTQFLGPQRNGISADKGLNWNWPEQPPKVLWKVPLGSGCSSLAVVGDKVFTMAKRGQRDIVVCLSTKDGKELWTYDAAPTYLDMQKQEAGPRATPTYHAGKIYCLFAQGELLCLTAEGKLVWEKSIFKDTGTPQPLKEFFYWGVSYSPLVEGNLVIVQPGGDKDNSVIAFHKDTGEIVWSTGSDPMGYSSPIMITVAGTRQLVCPTGASFLGIDPTQGTILWRYPFGNLYKVNCASPVWSDDTLFVSAAYGIGGAALALVKNSGGWEVKEKWRDKKLMQNLFATSMIMDKKIYGCSGDLGAILLRCLDLETGKMNWDQRLPKRSHLLAVDGRILIWDERGNLSFIEANPTSFQSKGAIPGLLAFKSWAAPALADGRLYLRDDRNVLCLDLRQK